MDLGRSKSNLLVPSFYPTDLKEDNDFLYILLALEDETKILQQLACIRFPTSASYMIVQPSDPTESGCIN